SSGIEPLKEAIAAKFRRDNGLEYSAKQIIVSCGAKHSIYNLMQALLDPGDEVIIPVPYWVSYPEQVKLAGGVPVYAEAPEENGFSKTYAMTGWRLGYLAGDAEIVAAMGRIQDQSTSNPTSFAQAGAVAALNGPQACVEEMKAAFRRRRDLIHDRLCRMPGV